MIKLKSKGNIHDRVELLERAVIELQEMIKKKKSTVKDKKEEE